MMPEGEETLAAELSLSGRRAWDKLHENLTSQITAVVDGEEMPITKVRNLYFRSEEEVRKKAYQAELLAWERHEVPLAYALNGVKGRLQSLTAGGATGTTWNPPSCKTASPGGPFRPCRRWFRKAFPSSAATTS